MSRVHEPKKVGNNWIYFAGGQAEHFLDADIFTCLQILMN